jgi:hypothetical protein
VPRILTIASLFTLLAANAMAEPSPPAAEGWVVVRDPCKLERNVLWSPGTSSVASLPAAWNEAVAAWHGRRIMVSATTSPFTEEGREVLKLHEPVRVAALLRSQPVWFVKIEAQMLIPFAPRPELARVPAEIADLLQSLASLPRTLVAVVSGRRRESLADHSAVAR